MQTAPSIGADKDDDAIYDQLIEFFEELPGMGTPALSLSYLHGALHDPHLLPLGYESRPLGHDDFVVEQPGSRPFARATLSKAFYGDHFDHTEFWTPASSVFPIEGAPGGTARAARSGGEAVGCALPHREQTAEGALMKSAPSPRNYRATITPS